MIKTNSLISTFILLLNCEIFEQVEDVELEDYMSTFLLFWKKGFLNQKWSPVICSAKKKKMKMCSLCHDVKNIEWKWCLISLHFTIKINLHFRWLGIKSQPMDQIFHANVHLERRSITDYYIIYWSLFNPFWEGGRLYHRMYSLKLQSCSNDE
jgi:hypothetical protein